MKFVSSSVLSRESEFSDELVYRILTLPMSVAGMVLFLLWFCALREAFVFCMPVARCELSDAERARMFVYVLHLALPTVAMVLYFACGAHKLALTGRLDDTTLEEGYEPLGWIQNYLCITTFLTAGVLPVMALYLYELVYLRDSRPMVILHHIGTVVLVNFGITCFVQSDGEVAMLGWACLVLLNLFFEQPVYACLFYRKVVGRLHYKTYLAVSAWNAITKLVVFSFVIRGYVGIFYVEKFHYSRFDIFWMIVFIPFQILLLTGNVNTSVVFYKLAMREKSVSSRNSVNDLSVPTAFSKQISNASSSEGASEENVFLRETETQPKRKKKKRKQKQRKDKRSFPAVFAMLPVIIFCTAQFYSKWILARQHTPQFVRQHKVVIVGGGVSGVLMAYLLDKFGDGKYKIDVFEREDRLGGAARPKYYNGSRIETAFYGYNENYHVFSALLRHLGIRQEALFSKGLTTVDVVRNITFASKAMPGDEFRKDVGQFHQEMSSLRLKSLKYLQETTLEQWLRKQNFGNEMKMKILGESSLFIAGDMKMNMQSFITYYDSGFMAFGPMTFIRLENGNDEHIKKMVSHTSDRVTYHLESEIKQFDPHGGKVQLDSSRTYDYDSIVFACNKQPITKMLKGNFGGDTAFTKNFLIWLNLPNSIEHTVAVAASTNHKVDSVTAVINQTSGSSVAQTSRGGMSFYLADDRNMLNSLIGATETVYERKSWNHTLSDANLSRFQRNLHKFQYRYGMSFVGADGMFASHEYAVASAFVVLQDMYGIEFPFKSVPAANRNFLGARHLMSYGIGLVQK